VNRQTDITRWLLIGAAGCSAAFWGLALVIGSFVGYAAVEHPLWIPSQLLHVLGALLVIPAIPGLMMFARSPYGALAPWSAAVAMIGSALFAADGVIALSVFPTLADNARMLLEPGQAMGSGIMLATYVVVGAVNMIGWIMVGAALWNGRAPNWITGLLLAGAVLFNLPPGPVPLFVLAIGGVLWSVALFVYARELAAGTTDTAPIKRMRPRTPRMADRIEE
jgi:hypothetical protein